MRKLLTKQKTILCAVLAVLLIFIGMTGCAKKQTAPTAMTSPTPTAAELSLAPTPSPDETSLSPEMTPTSLAGTESPSPSAEITPTASPNEASPSATPTGTTTVGPNRPTASPKPPTSTPRPSATPPPATRQPTPAPATPTKAPTTAPTTAPPAPVIIDAPQEFIMGVLAGLNTKRAAAGVDLYESLDPALTASARGHAIECAYAGTTWDRTIGVTESSELRPYLGQWGTGTGDGGAAVIHNSALARSECKKVGIAAVLYDDYIYIVVTSTTWTFD